MSPDWTSPGSDRTHCYKVMANFGDRIRQDRQAMIATTFDPQADAMFIRFAAACIKSARTEEVSPGSMLDFDEDGRLIEIEVLGVSARSLTHKEAA